MNRYRKRRDIGKPQPKWSNTLLGSAFMTFMFLLWVYYILFKK